MNTSSILSSTTGRLLSHLALFILGIAMVAVGSGGVQAAGNLAPSLAPPNCATPHDQTIRGKLVRFDECQTRTFSHGGNDYAIHTYFTLDNDPAIVAFNDSQCTATELASGRCEHALAGLGNVNLMAQEAEAAFRFYTDRNMDFAGTVPLPNDSILTVYIAEDPRAGGIPNASSIQVDDEWVDNNDQLQKRILAYHEVHHLVQIQYDTSWNGFYGEGVARAIEDRVDTALDADAGHLFIPQVNGIISNDGDRSSDINTTSYSSVLWWTWVMDRYRTGGQIDPPVPPADIGWGALLDFYQELETMDTDTIGALDDFITAQGGNFRNDFIDYTLALYAYEYSPSDPRLGFLDNEINNTSGLSGHTVINSAPSLGTVFPFMNPRSSRYWEFNPASQCNFTSFTFDGNGRNYGFSVMTVDGGNLQDRWTSYSNNWARTVRTASLDRIVGVVTAFDQSGVVDLGRGCVNPSLNIKAPTTANFEMVGLADNPRNFIVRLSVTGAGGSAVAGLIAADFDVSVNLSPVNGGPDVDVPAQIISSAFVLDDYWLVVEAPSETDDASIANGLFFDLTVDLGPNSDSETAALVYLERTQDVNIVLDRSGSMGGTTGKIQAAQNAADLLVMQLADQDQGSFTAFDTDAVLRVGLDLLSAGTQRVDLENAIAAEVPLNFTSIGDGMRTALIEQIANGDPINLCSFVLLSDGHENETEFWATVAPDISAEGCPVHSIALGPGANEVLMQAISSTVPGGTYDYATTTGGVPINPVLDWQNNLSRIYSAKAQAIAGQQRILTAVGFGSSGFGGPSDLLQFTDQPITSHAIGRVFQTAGDLGTVVNVEVKPLLDGGVAVDPQASADISDSMEAGGNTPEIFTSNTDLEFDFGGPVVSASVRFADFGGTIFNLSIDGNVQEFGTIAAMDNASINSALVNVIFDVGSANTGEIVVDGAKLPFQKLNIGGQELFIDNVRFTGAGANSMPILVDDASDLLEVVVAWQSPTNGVSSTLVDPNNVPVPLANRRQSNQNTNQVWEVPAPIEGTYLLQVAGLGEQFVAIATALSRYELEMIIGAPQLSQGNQGAEVPIIGIFTGPSGPIPGANVTVEVTDPANNTRMMTLFDDGNHGDSLADDGVYGNVYTATSFADNNSPPPTDESSDPQGVGSYRVEMKAVRAPISREAEGYFAIQLGRDSDLDGMTDLYERLRGLDPTRDDAKEDPDMDGLTNLCESQLGTHPFNSDTDGGGESDGSEVDVPTDGSPCRATPQDPLDPSDDRTSPISSVNVIAEATVNRSPFTRIVLGRPTGNMLTPVFDILRQDVTAGPGGFVSLVNGFVGDEFVDDDQATNQPPLPDRRYVYKVMPSYPSFVGVRVPRGPNIVTPPVLVLGDPYPPAGAVLINGGDGTVDTEIVSLNLSVDDSTRDFDVLLGLPAIPFDLLADLEMRLGNSQAEVLTAAYQPYAAVIPAWNLGPQNDGDSPVVYAQFRDTSGNESEVVADSILFRQNLVGIFIEPQIKTVSTGEVFDLEIVVRPGGQPVAGAQAFVDFDTAKLRVLAVTNGTTLVDFIDGSNSFDNTLGQVDYVAGNIAGVTPFPTTDFTLATLRLEALMATPGTLVEFSISPAIRETFVSDPQANDITGSRNDGFVEILDAVILELRWEFEGGARPQPAGWEQPVRVVLTGSGGPILFGGVSSFDAATAEAFIQVPAVPFDTYDILLEERSTLTNRKVGVVVGLGSPPVNMGTLLSGDGLDDFDPTTTTPTEIINIFDYGLMAGAFGTSTGDLLFDPVADYDANGVINISDFGLVDKNFLLVGPVLVP